MEVKAFISLIGQLATKDMRESGVLASVTVAQACLESGYGSTELAVNANNIFGMKCKLSGNSWLTAWDGISKYSKQTKEQKPDGTEYIITAEFRRYPDIAASIKDHSNYLVGAMNGNTHRYEGISGEREYRKVANLIKDGGYATDIAYVDKLCNLIERWNLTQFDVWKEEETELNINRMISNYNYNQGNIGRIKYIVIHYVGALGDAKANCQYYGGGNRNASAHYFVGFAGDIWQCVEDANIAWHVGSSSYAHPECRNANAIGIEMCVRKRNTSSLGATDKDWYFEDATIASTVELTKYLMQKYGVSPDRVIRHYDVTGKICPNPYVYNTNSHTWDEFKKLITNGGGYEGGVGGNESGNASGLENYTPGLYSVKVDALNIRKGPSTNYEINGMITNRGTYTITEVQNGSWGRLKSGAGWINIDREYCTYKGVGAGDKNTTSETFMVKVDITDLYIRTAPSTNANRNGFCPKGTYTIVETKKADGYTWGKLKSGVGWIALEYATRV